MYRWVIAGFNTPIDVAMIQSVVECQCKNKGGCVNFCQHIRLKVKWLAQQLTFLERSVND